MVCEPCLTSIFTMVVRVSFVALSFFFCFSLGGFWKVQSFPFYSGKAPQNSPVTQDKSASWWSLLSRRSLTCKAGILGRFPTRNRKPVQNTLAEIPLNATYQSVKLRPFSRNDIWVRFRHGNFKLNKDNEWETNQTNFRSGKLTWSS